MLLLSTKNPILDIKGTELADFDFLFISTANKAKNAYKNIKSTRIEYFGEMFL